MDTNSEWLTATLDSASGKLEAISQEMATTKASDEARWQMLDNERKAHERQIEALKAQLGSVRAPSMAGIIGSGRNPDRGDASGSFVKAVMLARSRDAAEQAEGKAALDGYRYLTPAQAGSKATLGSTDATGGWVIPNALVDDIQKPATYSNPYGALLTVRTGVNTSDVDIPFRSAAPSRAVIAAWGDTKTNVDLAYNGYTATMYTLAAIYDLGNQFIRHSAGAAEADVMQELGHALGLGQAYYVREGTGSSQPYGFIEALNNAPSEFTTSHTASTSTIAGNMATAIGTAAAALVGRNRRPQAAVISATAYGELLTSGADTAGFFLSGISGPQSVPGFAPGTLVSPWGIPVVVDSEFPDDDLVVGDWSALRLYVGDGPRIDTSDQAGDRWDKNLTGFRGELEIAFDARPAVYSGALQYVADVIA